MAIILNKKNFLARSLKNPRFKQKIVKPKKGKGSFKRKKIR
jgi:stalled ribosome alternative rescue factor ArfA|tara:strand:+ start:155 stop:277 length:123 start_codon:yes stop_codon:yes gene_type:complete